MSNRCHKTDIQSDPQIDTKLKWHSTDAEIDTQLTFKVAPNWHTKWHSTDTQSNTQLTHKVTLKLHRQWHSTDTQSDTQLTYKVTLNWHPQLTCSRDSFESCNVNTRNGNRRSPWWYRRGLCGEKKGRGLVLKRGGVWY